MTPEEIKDLEKENERLRKEINELIMEKENLSAPIIFGNSVNNIATTNGNITITQ